MMYAAMAYLMLSANKVNGTLLRTIGGVDILASLMLFSRAVIALLDHTLVPYANAQANIALYMVAYVVLLANGFGFLLLVKQQDDLALKKSLEDLAQAENRERELLAIASHEFRTPAAIIKASLDSLSLLSETVPPDIARRLDNIRHASNRLNDLANTLIVRDRLHDPSIKNNMQAIKLQTLIEEVLAAYTAGQACSSNDWTDDPAMVQGDPALIRVALHNLIDNAIGHNELGETVSVSLLTNGEIAEIRVTDHGRGIPDAMKEKIFERFVSYKGGLAKGLGLNIVRSVAHIHGGHVCAQDNHPAGTIVLFSLPLRRDQ
jgi:signal transduction histidine kinase